MRADLRPQGNALDFTLLEDDAEVTQSAFGLPAVALSLTRIVNVNATPGVLASYAIPNRVLRERRQDAEF